MPELNKIYCWDCLELMKDIPDKSIDIILCDLPYWVTQNKRDSCIDLWLLWEQYERIIKDNWAIVLFWQDKFSAKLMLSNEKLHKYNLIRNKVLQWWFLNANRMPMRVHEDILVFYKNLPVYNPQKVKWKKNHSMGKNICHENECYWYHKRIENDLWDMKHPNSIITFQKPHPSKCLHPTEKSLELCERLIKTYTNEWMLVLDNTCGSWTTCLAAKNLKRNFIGIEKEQKYVDIANKRLSNTTISLFT